MDNKESTEKPKELRSLFDYLEPFDTGMLPVSSLHSIYYEVTGNKEGLPVVILHGGPGRGSNPVYRGFFDNEKYYIVQLDQRGSGKSTPLSSIEENTTWDLVEDIEKLKCHLNVQKWHIVIGGSWGSALALVYSQKYPTSVSNIIVAAVFLATKEEIHFFHQEGTNWFFPEYHTQLKSLLPEKEQDDIVKAYNHKINNNPNADPQEQLIFAKMWTKWEAITSYLIPKPEQLDKVDNNKDLEEKTLTFGKIGSHYLYNHAFLDEDSQILKNCHKIMDIPTIIIHGRYDLVCPYKGAYDLSKQLKNSELITIDNAGHSGGEPGMIDALVQATNKLYTSNIHISS